MRDENITKLNSLVPAAIEALEEIVAENDSKVRVKAAKEILNRAGYKTQDQAQGQPITISMYAPPWARKKGEEDKEIIEITIPAGSGEE